MNRLFKTLYWLPAVALFSIALSACSDKKEKDNGPALAIVACDDSFEKILQQEIDVFEYSYPKFNVMPYYVTEKAAVDSLLDLGDVRTIVIARPLTTEEKDYLKSNKKNVRERKIAVDALALIVNPKNTIEQLSTKELSEILSGKVTEWGEIEPNKLGKIDVVFDHQGSSTVKYMRDSLLNGGDFGPNVFAQKSNKEVFEAVANNPRAIGIIGVSWISSDMDHAEKSTEELAREAQASDTTTLDFDNRVKVLKVSGPDQVVAYKPYQAYIFDGSYPLFRSIYMTTVATGGTAGSNFYVFVTGFIGQKIIQMTGVLPATVTPRMVSLD
ncbi:MAG: substrate-binding domain-containing protein [Muribaculaceae bacterium]|nr:substrate-binding domain-containing protein [Muribaculaceae bacterium]